jgi:hypothetical protein
MALVDTRSLEGAALNWAVAQCLDIHWDETSGCFVWPQNEQGQKRYSLEAPNYLADWSLAGEIIESEKIELTRSEGEWIAASSAPVEYSSHRQYVFTNGETALIAAMRCFATCKLGQVIEVPEKFVRKPASGMSL